MGKESSLENLPKNYEEDQQVPSKSYSSTGQKMKNKQARQRPLSSTGRMNNNFKIMKSDKKPEEDSEEEEN